MSADGLRLFLINTTAFYWSDWNGTTYGTIQTTGIAGSATNSCVGCNTDGSRVLYAINSTTWNYAVWNGITYVILKSFVATSTSTIQSILWSYDNKYAFLVANNQAGGSIQCYSWNQDGNTFSNLGFLPLSSAPASINMFAMAIDNSAVYQMAASPATVYKTPLNYTIIPSAVPGYSFTYWFKSAGSQDYAGLLSFQGVNGWIAMFLLNNGLYAAVNEQTFSLPASVLPSTMQNHVQVATIAQNTWYHVCWTIQQVSTNYNTVGSAIWTVYINGQPVYQSAAQRYPYPGKRSLNFLGFNGLNNVYLNGTIDEYRTYQTVLTAGEVLAIYNSTNVFS